MLAEDPDWRVRITVAGRSDVGVEVLERMLSDEDAGVRWRAGGRLATISAQAATEHRMRL
jgi:HEAT repeat protein